MKRVIRIVLAVLAAGMLSSAVLHATTVKPYVPTVYCEIAWWDPFCWLVA